MSTSPTGSGGSSVQSSWQHGIPNTRTDHRMTNVGNVLNSYNTINVGIDEESLQIQAWLSPLEPRKRHQDVRNRRLDGVGDWVLQRDEFKSWCGGQDSSQDPTLRCYGGQGVGKTYMRYVNILQKPSMMLTRIFKSVH